LGLDITRFRRHKLTSSLKLLKRKRTRLVEMTLSTDSIVKTFNVVKHVGLGFMAGGIDATLDSLHLCAAEEGLGNRSVPAVPASTHAGHQMVISASEMELITSN
jgi:hypothetical protein